MKFKRTVLLAIFLVTMSLLLGTNAVQAANVKFDDPNDPTKATRILDLDVGGTLYNVAFNLDATAKEIYGEYPGDFFFTTASDAGTARDAVVAALNAEGAVSIGERGVDELETLVFLIGYESFVGPFGVELVTSARGFREDNGSDWLDGGESQVTAYYEGKTYAEFTFAGDPTDPVTIGGTVFGLESLLVLENNGTDWLITFDNGPFEFETPLTEGDSYNVSVLFNLPGETCIVVNGSGVADANVTDIFVVCGPAAEQVTIGGTVTGLEGSGILGSDLVLQNNGSDDLTITENAPFEFDTPLTPGASYNVTVLTNPTNPAQECFVARGSGSVPFEDVTNVAVLCAPPDEGPPPPEPHDVCTRNSCAVLEDLQEECNLFMDQCLAEADTDFDEEQCVGGALLICGELF